MLELEVIAPLGRLPQVKALVPQDNVPEAVMAAQERLPLSTQLVAERV